jgi:thiol-disulfide isomerase/thioredoxin
VTRAARLARDLLLVAALVFGIRYFQTRDMPSGPAPSLAGMNLAGELVSLDDFRGGPVVVYFWASWCGVCKAIAGNVDSLAGRTTVIRVAVQSGSRDQVAKALGPDTPGLQRVILDPEGRLAASWGVGAFPTLFWLDDEAAIRFTEVGYTSSLGMRARSFFAAR